MKESQSKKTSRLTKVIISLGVVLATTFFTFLIGKWNSIPAKGIANESSNQVNTQQQEKKRNTTSKTEKT